MGNGIYEDWGRGERRMADVYHDKSVPKVGYIVKTKGRETIVFANMWTIGVTVTSQKSQVRVDVGMNSLPGGEM